MSLKILFVSLLSIIISSNAGTLRSATNKIYIGGALEPNYFSDEKYKNLAAEQLSCVTPENVMKWTAVENHRNNFTYENGDKLVDFAKKYNMKVRGTTIIWHIDIPVWVKSLNNSELKATFKKHITDEVTHFKGKIYCWALLNEILNENGTYRDTIWYENFQDSYVSEAFKIAHLADPNAKLYINEYNIEGKNNKSDALYDLVKHLKSDGIPIHGVGFQAHFEIGKVPKDFESNMKRFADLGLDVAVTELDIRIDLPSTEAKLQQQAKDYALVVKSCLNIPKCVGVTFWGLTDKHSWVPDFPQFKNQGDALPFDANYKPKPAVAAMEAVLKAA